MADSGQLNHHDAGNTKVTAVILDLDGTLLNTEFVLRSVLKEYLASYGKVMITDSEHGRVGKTQKESAAAIVKNYELPLTPDQYLSEINPLYHSRWNDAKALPGANRLIWHLHMHHIPLAIALNSLREYIEAKISNKKGWKECLPVIVGSDQVKSGKPSPDLFLEAAKQLAVDPSNCLVVEDSLVGVKAGKAAGMKVVVVPSDTEADAADLADLSLNSLLDFQPDVWGLPPFDDWVKNTLPVNPIYLEGQLINGFLAEFPAEEDGQINALPQQTCGIYFGWASTGISKDLKVVVCIKRQLSSTSQRKIELTSIDENIGHLNGERMNLVLVGYIRGFSFKETLPMEWKIQEDDKDVALSSLKLPVFRCPNSDGFLA